MRPALETDFFGAGGGAGCERGRRDGGSLVSRPAPEMKLTTPLGKQSRNTSIVGMWAARAPAARHVWAAAGCAGAKRRPPRRGADRGWGGGEGRGGSPRQPTLGSFITTELPMRIAGMSVV